MRGLLVVVFAAVVSMVNGWPTGADPGRCESMVPGHGTVQTGPNSHTVTASASEYTPGETVEVTISGEIRGLLIQARKADGSSTTPYGTFSVDANDGLKAMECTVDNDAATHSNTDPKTDVKLTWTAPASDVGKLKFVATVLEGKETWWMNAESGEMAYKAEENGSPTVSATTLLVSAGAALCLLKAFA